MASFMNSIKMLLEGKTEQTSVDKAHFCATHVEHAEYGKGVCISEQHAEPNSNGDIDWYMVQFESKDPIKVMTSEMKVLQAENHMHSKKKMKESTDIEEAKLSPKQKAIAKMSEPAHKIDAGDFAKLRAGHKPVAEQLKPGESAPGVKGKWPESKPETKPESKFASKKTSKGTQYSRKLNDDVEVDTEQNQDLVETIIKHSMIELPEELTYSDYLSAVRQIVDTEDPEFQSQIISIAAEAYDRQEFDLIIEARTKEFAQKTVDDLRKSGKTVSDPEMVTHQGKPGYKYTVKNGDKETVTIHTAQGVVRKVK